MTGRSDRKPSLLPSGPNGRRIVTPSRARQTITAGAITRHRVAVTIAKWLLPLAALGLLSLLVLWPEIDRETDRGRLSFRRTTQVTPEAARVINPRYQGVDNTDRPYTVTAAVAAQRGTSNLVDLEKPRADISLGNGAWVLLESDTGLNDRDKNTLDLDGHVTLWHDNGTTMTTGKAAIDLTGGNASGNTAVAAQGPFGTLTSDGFSLIDRGRVVVFTGHAHAVLEGSSP